MTQTMFSPRIAAAAAIATGVSLIGAPATAATTGAQGISLGNNGRMLVTMTDLTRPAALTGIPLFGPGGVTSLDALAYRPRTEELYGYNTVTRTVYRVNMASGALDPVAVSSVAIDVAEVGFDFNTLIDAARLVSTADDNQVFFPNAVPPTVVSATPLFYGAGDVHVGVNPSVFANAYTNQVAFPAATLQYVLDSETDSLATLANNAGVLTTVGAITLDGVALDFTSAGGFDIFSAMDGDNRAFALLTTANGLGLYGLGLSAGPGGTVAATYLGAVGDAFGALDSLAVVPAPVPLPASVLLMGAALGGLGLLRRRRRPPTA